MNSSFSTTDHHPMATAGGCGSLPGCNYKLPGAMIRRMMRRRGVTIRSLAEKFNITQKRVREVRANGVAGFLASEWNFMITGEWLD